MRSFDCCSDFERNAGERPIGTYRICETRTLFTTKRRKHMHSSNRSTRINSITMSVFNTLKLKRNSAQQQFSFGDSMRFRIIQFSLRHHHSNTESSARLSRVGKKTAQAILLMSSSENSNTILRMKVSVISNDDLMQWMREGQKAYSELI